MYGNQTNSVVDNCTDPCIVFTILAEVFPKARLCAGFLRWRPMQTIIVILRFEGGQEIALIGPAQEIPDEDIESATFSVPSDMEDMMISDITRLRVEKATTH